MGNQEAKKANEEETHKTQDLKTIEDYYNDIDSRVQKFTAEFISFLPQSTNTNFNMQLIVDRLLTVKESAKLLVNNFVMELKKKTEESKDD